jgi:hypothetical protein
MDGRVKVCCDDNGDVIIQSKKNPDWGHIVVEQYRMEIDKGGFAKRVKYRALIPGKITDLKHFDWKADQEIDGIIIFKESLTPFNPKEPDYDVKVAGSSGVVCTLEGQIIYRKMFYSLHPGAKNIAIQHDNEEEIKSAYDEIKSHLAAEESQNLSDEFSL